MHAFLGTLVALLASVQFVWGEFVLHAVVPAVFRNEEVSKIGLTLTGELSDAVVTEVRTVLQTPGKRRAKPYLNLTHAAPESSQDSHAGLMNLRAVYSLPTKTYLVSYSARLDFGDDQEALWVDSEEHEVKVVDPEVSAVKFLTALVVLLSTVLSLVYLSFYMTNAGWWESVLPTQLHGILPKPAKKRT